VVARSRRVVFIIDADDASRVTHETILRTEGFEIISAPDGSRALPLVREQVPALLLLGHKIGQMNVAKLIELVRADPVLRSVPVAVHGPRADGAMSEAVMRAGANVYIGTTDSPHDFMREIFALIGRT
jgi:response regulator RpfG family c-di-GMP phosphodiesterase